MLKKCGEDGKFYKKKKLNEFRRLMAQKNMHQHRATIEVNPRIITHSIQNVNLFRMMPYMNALCFLKWSVWVRW